MDSSLNFLKQQEDVVFFNPRLPVEIQVSLQAKIKKHFLGQHIWLMSSGTESSRETQYKFVALSHAALLAAASGVCAEFSINASDILLNVLPPFHISGISYITRAEVSGARAIDQFSLGWDEKYFVNSLLENNVTVTSLVPTQIFDLVKAHLPAPKKLKVVFVGGGALDGTLYQQAQALGWPLVRTYGMTETSAMVAYISGNETQAQRLPHLIEWRHTEDNRLQMKGPSLLTGFLLIDEKNESWLDPKNDGWYTSDDRGEINYDRLTLWGRDSELVKIKGETVSLVEMNKKWQSWQNTQANLPQTVIIAAPHARDGYELLLVSEGNVDSKSIEIFNKTVLPFQRLQKTFSNISFPRTDLGKIKTAELLKKLRS